MTVELKTDPVTRKAEEFPPGNDLAVKHGAYATLKLSPRAKEIATMLADATPGVSPAALEVFGTILARIEAADQAIADADARDLTVEAALPLERLRQDLRGWVNVALRYFESLGMTPMASARISESLADRSTNVQVNVAAMIEMSPEWRALEQTIVQALQPHPEALADVLLALAPGDREEALDGPH